MLESIELGKVMQVADSMRAIGRTSLAGQPTAHVRLKPDGSPVMEADDYAEKAIIELLRRTWPDMAVLSEEKDTELLEVGRFPWLASLDPLDGGVPFPAGVPDWSISLGILKDGVPYAAVINQPGYGRSFIALRGEGVYRLLEGTKGWEKFKRVRSSKPMIGLDLPPAVARNPEYWEMMRKLILAFEFPRNQPSVASGVELVLGHTWAWVTASIARHWDVAATALLVEMIGGVAECLDGTPIPWQEVKMPPLLFAESPTAAAKVRAELGI